MTYRERQEREITNTNPKRFKFFGAYFKHRDDLNKLEAMRGLLTEEEYNTFKDRIEAEYQQYIIDHYDDYTGWQFWGGGFTQKYVDEKNQKNSGNNFAD